MDELLQGHTFQRHKMDTELDKRVIITLTLVLNLKTKIRVIGIKIKIN